MVTRRAEMGAAINANINSIGLAIFPWSQLIAIVNDDLHIFFNTFFSVVKAWKIIIERKFRSTIVFLSSISFPSRLQLNCLWYCDLKDVRSSTQNVFWVAYELTHETREQQNLFFIHGLAPSSNPSHDNILRTVLLSQLYVIQDPLIVCKTFRHLLIFRTTRECQPLQFSPFFIILHVLSWIFNPWKDGLTSIEF